MERFQVYREREIAFRKIAKGAIPDTVIDEIIGNTDFLTAPASTRFHGAYEGGLFDHSYTVTEVLLDYTKRLGLAWEDEKSPIRVGLFHDFCKLDSYVVSEDGSYSYNRNQLFSGHGMKSAVIAQGFMGLNREEIMCITYHMGAYTEKEEWEYYSRAVEKYPNVLFTHTADMFASKVLEV